MYKNGFVAERPFECDKIKAFPSANEGDPHDISRYALLQAMLQTTARTFSGAASCGSKVGPGAGKRIGGPIQQQLRQQ